jgi:hypothetical protein
VSIVKIAPSALDHHRGIARAAEFPARERRCVCQREDDSIRTKSHTRVFTAAFKASLAIVRFALDADAIVERHRLCARVLRDLTRRRTRVALVLPGRPGPLAVTPRGHLRPDKLGRERPPAERVRGRLPGVAEGVARAPSSLDTIIRAASAAAENAAAFSMTARAQPCVR